MHTSRTLELTEAWDITLDGVGKIKLTHDDYAIAQAVANEIRLFVNDAYFVQDKGVPHFMSTLGTGTSIAVLRSYIRTVALSVNGVGEILSIEINDFDPTTRTLSGSVTFKSTGTGNVIITDF